MTIDLGHGSGGPYEDPARPPNITIAIGAAIAYLHFRLPDLAPKAATHPGVAAWYEGFAKRASVAATAAPPA